MNRNLLLLITIIQLLFPTIWAGAQEDASLTDAALAAIVTGMPDHEARFLEVRRLHLLNEPLRLEGRLRFVAPDRVEKHTTSPLLEELIVQGEWVSVRLYERKNDRRFRISDDPVLHALLVTLLAVLNGDPVKLHAFYRVEATGTPDDWRMRLIPTAEELASRVSVVDVSGTRNRLARIEILETTGDSMEMTIEYDPGG